MSETNTLEKTVKDTVRNNESKSMLSDVPIVPLENEEFGRFKASMAGGYYPRTSPYFGMGSNYGNDFEFGV